MNVESVLRQKGTEVTTIAPEATVQRAADWLRAKNIGSLVVTSGISILGVISEREIVHALSQFGEQVASMAVKDIMRHGLVTVAPEDDLSRVMKLMTRHRMRHMPVLRDSCRGSSALAMSLSTGWMTWNLKPMFCATRTSLTIDASREL